MSSSDLARIRARVYGLVAVTVAGVAAPAHAQHPVLSTQPPRPDSLAEQAADREAIAQDSAAGLRWMVGGLGDWSRYGDPEQCIAAINISQMTATRTQWQHPMTIQDTLSTAARAAGRACADRFKPSTAGPHALLAYFRLAVALDDVPLAMAIVDTRLTQAKTPDEKGSVIADAVRDLDGRSPAQRNAADSLIQRIASFGPAARWWEVTALQEYPEIPIFDTTRMTQRFGRSDARYFSFSRDERMKSGTPANAMGNDWMDLAEYRRWSPDSVCRAQQHALLSYGPDSIRGATGPMLANATAQGCISMEQSSGTSVAPLSGGTWFIPGDTTPKGPLGYPRAGRVTLIVNSPVGSGRPTPLIAMYQRLSAKYANDGLDIVLLHRRNGYMWGSGLISPATENSLIRWYDHDYLKLPFPLAVYDSAAPDMPVTMLVGRNGREYTSSALAAEEREWVLDAFIEQALAEPPSAR